MEKIKMNKLLLSLVVITALMMGCGKAEVNNSDTKMQAKTEKSMQEMNRRVGMPAISNFQERKLAKLIFELRDKSNLICYAYIKSDYTGKYTFIGKCIGYGLPYSIQYTNPMKIVDDPYTHYKSNDRGITIPQADPNGLFMPSGLSATWLMLIDPVDGKPKPAYIEETITVTQFLLPKSVLN